MFKPYLIAIALAVSIPLVALADGDPTLQQVYQAANGGHLDQAQTMMAQVLRDHPNSAKAHYIAAELDAKQGQSAAARGELQIADRLEPGLPFAQPDSVRALRAELGARSPGVQTGGYANSSRSPAASGIPWGLVIGVVVIIGFVMLMLRRRQATMMTPYPQSYPGNGMPPGYGYGGPGMQPGGGLGSGMVGGLASGLAVGAGVVAGEEIAHHLLDGNSSRGFDNSGSGGFAQPPLNQDMGGNDFGVNDTSSWDDSSGGGGDIGGDVGGGDSWS